MMETPHLDELKRLAAVTEKYAADHEQELRAEAQSIREAKKRAQEIEPSLHVVNGSTEVPAEGNGGVNPP